MKQIKSWFRGRCISQSGLKRQILNSMLVSCDTNSFEQHILQDKIDNLCFLKMYPVGKQTFCIFLQLRRHIFFHQEFTCFEKSTRSTVIKTIGFPRVTK